MQEFILKNHVLKAHFLDYGATLHQLWIKDKNGQAVNVIMGMPSPEDYRTDPWFRGAVIGRFAGRLLQPIAIDGKVITLENSEGVLLHSGTSSWGKKNWLMIDQQNDGTTAICFKISCEDGNSGFPGKVDAEVTYRLVDHSIIIEYKATTDKTTPMNLTNHAYFNLGNAGNIDTHQLQINASQYLGLGSDLVPNGKLLPTAATAFDFQTLKSLGNTRLDDCFVLDDNASFAARLYAPETGIEMKTLTDQPGVVVFTPPNFDAICFETQKFSNGLHIPHFPNTLLSPGETYQHKTTYTFTVDAAE